MLDSRVWRMLGDWGELWEIGVNDGRVVARWENGMHDGRGVYILMCDVSLRFLRDTA